MKTFRIAAAAIVIAFAATGCSSGEDSAAPRGSDQPTLIGEVSTPPPFPARLTRSDGKALTLRKAPARIVSLSPAATETLLAIGARSQVAAISDDPGLPADAAVFSTRLRAPFQAAEVAALNPDLVIVDADAGNLIAELDARNIPVLFRNAKDVRTLFDVFGEISVLGQATGRTDKALEIVGSLNSRVKRIDDVLKGIRPGQEPRLYHEGGPDFSSASDATLAGDVYRVLRASNIAGGSELPFPVLSQQAIVAADPEVIVLAYGGASVDAVKSRPGWANVAAVKSGLIFTVDPVLLRPGPRIVDALEQLAKSIYPTLIQ